eukprot:TRINITY_DN597_c0_g1_i1.p1 TRINITY_DN597_c0_g1~~TRINITY_DN597_c0_g1_i1.p1  ORF type:complete len:937 (-),score=245.43 TRINITY_DN597_c0_g1_i1:89-2899(-)
MQESKFSHETIHKKIEKEKRYFNIFDEDEPAEHVLVDLYNQINQIGKDFEIPEFMDVDLIHKIISNPRETIRPKKPRKEIAIDEHFFENSNNNSSNEGSPFNTPPKPSNIEIPFPSMKKGVEIPHVKVEVPKRSSKNPFDSPKNSPKNSYMEFNSPNHSPINSFSESPKNSPSKGFFESPKNSPRNSPRNSKGSRIMNKKNLKGEEDKKMHKYYFWDFIKSSLFHNPKTEDGYSFHDVIRELGKDIKRAQELAANMVNKTLFELFIKVKPINHVKGQYWSNWGETLKCRAKFIFSDDGEKPAGYLGFKNNKFHLESRSGEILGQQNNKFRPEDHVSYNSPVTLDHLKAITKLAEKTKLKVKAFGSSHSWAPIQTTNGILVDTRKINYEEGIERVQIMDQDPRTDHPSFTQKGKLLPTVTCSPGISTGALEIHLWELTDKKDKRYSLEASTIEEVFTIGGIAFTSSHGTGKKCVCLSDILVAMTIVTYSGEVITITPNECPDFLLYDEKKNKDLEPEDIWRAAQVNLGAFGIVYDMTLVIRPEIDAYFVTEVVRWDKYFGDNEQARQELFRLNSEWDTLEFWHYPLTFAQKGRNITIKDILFSKVTSNPTIHITKTMANKPPSGYTVVEKKPIDFYTTLLFQTVGANFSTRMWRWALNSKIGKHFRGHIVAFATFGVQRILGNEEKKIAWKVPQFVANHPLINATTVVEHVPVCDIEWEIETSWSSKEGLRNASNVYRHLCESIAKAFQKNEFPVTINVEMRFSRGSGSPLSMQYIPGQSYWGSQDCHDRRGINNIGFAAPEIVTHSPNPFWDEFYTRMNKNFMKNKEHFGDNIRLHLAKQFCSIKGMLKHMRKVYDDERVYFYPFDEERRRNFKYKTALKLWREVRNRFDPEKFFVNPFIEQFFYSDNDTYTSPESDGFFISEMGGVNDVKNCAIL